MKNQAIPPNNTQSGSIFVWIFIMIALFGALSYAMSQGSRSGASTLTSEQQKLAVTELLTQTKSLREAVQQLRIGGCTDTQISFEGEPTTEFNYVNPNAPLDKSCHVFDSAGAGLRWGAPPKAFYASGTNPRWLIQGSHCYEGVGSGPPSATCPDTAKELELNLYNIPLELCQKINESSGIGTPGAPPPSENWNSAGNGTSAFQGVYSTGNVAATIIQGIGASGKMFGCYTDNTGSNINQHIFYYTLIAR